MALLRLNFSLINSTLDSLNSLTISFKLLSTVYSIFGKTLTYCLSIDPISLKAVLIAAIFYSKVPSKILVSDKSSTIFLIANS